MLETAIASRAGSSNGRNTNVVIEPSVRVADVAASVCVLRTILVKDSIFPLIRESMPYLVHIELASYELPIQSAKRF